MDLKSLEWNHGIIETVCWVASLCINPLSTLLRTHLCPGRPAGWISLALDVPASGWV